MKNFRSAYLNAKETKLFKFCSVLRYQATLTNYSGFWNIFPCHLRNNRQPIRSILDAKTHLMRILRIEIIQGLIPDAWIYIFRPDLIAISRLSLSHIGAPIGFEQGDAATRRRSSAINSDNIMMASFRLDLTID